MGYAIATQPTFESAHPLTKDAVMTTDQIEIYVRSSPLGAVGIHWRNVSKPEQPKEDPEILAIPIVPDGDSKISVDSAINTVKPCLVLAKYCGKVFLEVTGIDATCDRSEKLGRRISEVVLWVGDANGETEKQLRKLAQCALTGLWNQNSKFRVAISQSIKFDGLNDYEVNAEELRKIYFHPENYVEDEFLSSEAGSSSAYDCLESQEIKSDDIDEANKKVFQLAVKLRESLFNSVDTAVIIAEVKQTEDKIWLNYRGDVAEPKTSLVIPPSPQTDHQESSFEEYVYLDKETRKKKQTKKANLQPIQSRRRLVAFALLILLLIALLWVGKKYLVNYRETIDQHSLMLEVNPNL